MWVGLPLQSSQQKILAFPCLYKKEYFRKFSVLDTLWVVAIYFLSKYHNKKYWHFLVCIKKE